MTTKLKISALATALTVGLVALSTNVYATSGSGFDRIDSGNSLYVQGNTNEKAINKRVIAGKLQDSQGRQELQDQFGLNPDWFDRDGNITDEGKNHVLIKDGSTFKSETYLDAEERVKFEEQKAALAAEAAPGVAPQNKSAESGTTEGLQQDGSQNPAPNQGQKNDRALESKENNETNQDQSPKQNQEENTPGKDQQKSPDNQETPDQGTPDKTGEDNTDKKTEEGSKNTSTTPTPNTSANSALTEAELSLASTAVTGTLATAPVALVGNVQAVAGSFFDAVGSNFSSAPSLLTDAGTVTPAVGSDAGKEFLGTPVSRDDLAPGYHVYFDYGYRNHTLKVSSANSKVKQHNFAVGFYAQDAGLNYGLALVKSNGTNTSTPTKARTWTKEVEKEGGAKEKVTKSSNYASRTKSNSTGLMGSVGLASNTDFVNFGAFVLFSNTKNYRSSVGFEDQYSSVDSRQYGFDLTYGHRLYKDNNSSVVVKAGLTDVYYTQDAFSETATTDAAKAEVLSFQKMSKNNVFLHLGVQGTYLARVNDYLFQTDAGLKLEQALTNNRFDFKLKDGTVVKGAAGDTFTARLVVGETLYVDNFSLRLGAEFATGNKTNARLDKLTATFAYKF